MMYFFDYGIYRGSLEAAKEDVARGRKKSNEERLAAWRSNGRMLTNKQLEAGEYTSHDKRMCERSDDQGLLHSRNDTWLEVRTWNNDLRGITTLFGWAVYLMFGKVVFSFWADAAMLYFTGHHLAGSNLHAWTLSEIALHGAGLTLAFGAFFFAMHRFFLRYELLTQRWIRLRFNRKTRKVYLLRPKYAGGLTVFDWTDTQPGLPEEVNPDAPCLHWALLVWGNEELDQPSVMQGIARRTSFKTQGDWMAFWEYIRRYMEEGPESVGQPKTVIGYGPSLREAWISVTQWYPVLQQKGGVGRIGDGITLLILPLIALMFIGNFLGQCLTWQARFPKEIEDAGKDV